MKGVEGSDDLFCANTMMSSHSPTPSEESPLELIQEVVKANDIELILWPIKD